MTDLDYGTYIHILVAKQALETADVKDFTDWAEQLLAKGCDFENMRILASFALETQADLNEVERYFAACLHDLGLDIPSANIAIWVYAQALVKAITEKTLKPSTGLGLLKSLWIATDYTEPLYNIWYELAVDVYSLDHQEAYLWNAELTEHNIDEVIIKVAEQFLQLSQYQLPIDFFDLTACVDCHHVGKAAEQRIEQTWLALPLFRLIYGRNPTTQPICEHCASTNLKSMRDYEGRAVYLISKQVITEK